MPNENFARIECLKCQQPMLTEETKENLVIDVCTTCNGIWLDGGELGLAGWQNGLPKADSVQSSRLTCPRCEIELKALTYNVNNAAVQIEQCPECAGIWVDGRTELNALQQMPKKVEAVTAAKGNSTKMACAGCSADIKFAPGTTNLKCPYCGVENQIALSEKLIYETDLFQYLATQQKEQPQYKVMVVKCKECAAETTLEPNVTAAACAYCGASLVLTAEATQLIKPIAVLPFKVEKRTAQDSFQKWLSGLWFAPNDLKEYARADSRLVGTYMPYWTFDARTLTAYTGQRGEHYYVTVTGHDGKKRTERRTRWYPASGRVAVNFDDLPVPASKSLPMDKVDALEPWDMKQLKPYQDEFLRGFRAESYAIGLKEGFEIGKNKMAVIIDQAIRRDIGGDEQQIHSKNSSYADVLFKHILLPIWISAYKYRSKVYRFIVNGCTGEVQGERPWSWIKITLAVIAGLILLYIFLSLSGEN